MTRRDRIVKLTRFKGTPFKNFCGIANHFFLRLDGPVHQLARKKSKSSAVLYDDIYYWTEELSSDEVMELFKVCNSVTFNAEGFIQ